MEIIQHGSLEFRQAYAIHEPARLDGKLGFWHCHKKADKKH